MPDTRQFHMQMGKERVAARIHDLNSHIEEELNKLDRVKLITPLSSELSAGIVCFEVDGMTPLQVVRGLEKENIVASTTPYETSYARFSPGILNDHMDMERAIIALRDVITKAKPL